MGAVVDRSTVVLATLKDFMGIDNDAKDALLQIMLDAAKEFADEYLNNPFTTLDDDGEVVELDIPNSVELALLKIGATYALDRDPTITSVREGALAQSYSSPEAAIKNIATGYLKMYRLEPGL